MNPDAYMPYYGSDFETATKGFRREVKWSYLAACWHYWTHTHCKGLPDDDESLRLISDCPEGDWARTRGLIFGPLFKLGADGLWHQKRTRKEWEITFRAYSNRVEGARIARESARADTKSDTSPDNNPVGSDNQNQNQNQSQEPEQGTHTKVDFPKLAEVLTRAQFIGMTPEAAEQFWNHFEASGWVDKNGNPVVNWQAKMKTWNTQARSAPLESAHKAGEQPVRQSGADTVVKSNELNRCLDRIKKMKENAARDAMGTLIFSEKEKTEMSKLIKRRDELKKLLGVMV